MPNEGRRPSRIAWVTCAGAHGGDVDEPIGVAALRRRGLGVDVVDWDDPQVDWPRFDVVLLRSAWDYPERIDEFEAWTDSVARVSTLVNPLAVIRWSSDKHYLADLDAAGIPITPSRFVEIGEPPVFPSDESGFVVKPTVGAGSRSVVRYPATGDARLAARVHIADLHAEGRAVVVQPALDSVQRLGEWPIIFLGGEFSHAAHRRVALPVEGSTADLWAPEINEPAEATPEMRAVAEATIAYVHANVGPTTYARVDLVLDDDGKPVVMEVELVEPSLFLPEHPPAADRLAALLT